MDWGSVFCPSPSGLSSLPDNPGDSRFWTASPARSPDFRVSNLPNNHRSLPFLVRPDFHNYKILNVLSCLTMLLLGLVRQGPFSYISMSPKGKGGLSRERRMIEDLQGEAFRLPRQINLSRLYILIACCIHVGISS